MVTYNMFKRYQSTASLGTPVLNPNPGVSKLRPLGQMRPAESFHVACKAVLRKMLLIYNVTYPETIT